MRRFLVTTLAGLLMVVGMVVAQNHVTEASSSTFDCTGRALGWYDAGDGDRVLCRDGRVNMNQDSDGNLYLHQADGIVIGLREGPMLLPARTGEFQVVGEGGGRAAAVIAGYYPDNGREDGPGLIFVRARGSIASPQTPLAGDKVADIVGYVYDGTTNWVQETDSTAARIRFNLTANASDHNTPGEIVFETTSNNSWLSSPRVKITTNGDLSLVRSEGCLQEPDAVNFNGYDDPTGRSLSLCTEAPVVTGVGVPTGSNAYLPVEINGHIYKLLLQDGE